MLFVGTSIIHPSTEGVFLLCNILDLLIYRYKDNTMNDWKVGGTLTANNQQLSGAEFSGSQLGTPDYAMKLKGVTYCHATAGNSSDKRIVMGYLYNPQKTGYSISFSYNGGGISYSPSGTAYTAYKTMNLSY